MGVIVVLLPFLVAGLIVAFAAFFGGPSGARQAYLTGGPRLFRVTVGLIVAVCGIVVPALAIAAKQDALGGVGSLRNEAAEGQLARGKQLFKEVCATCHTLDAVQAKGVVGPNLDQLAPLDRERVLRAIRIGGTGQQRMPAGLLSGEDAQAVATYVARVAGRAP
ncbi:c-type cytochrome [Thermoleophilum album]|uniref:c-type cytochrome n=1 Tax=Thermoleophilum album TaxID=29539 RepID=UPI0019AEC8CA|nr:cytochrome c [Thermoleophilum album]WDT94252.1 c-type cytochrome [Thermoleophilum album]